MKGFERASCYSVVSFKGAILKTGFTRLESAEWWLNRLDDAFAVTKDTTIREVFRAKTEKPA